MDELLEIFKALSDETRLKILVLLYHNELCVCEICDVLEESQPKVSRHLAKLRDAGLTRDERRGQWVFYYFNSDHVLLKKIIEAVVSCGDGYPAVQRVIQRLHCRTKCC